jgi:hypothetical protein
MPAMLQSLVAHELQAALSAIEPFQRTAVRFSILKVLTEEKFYGFAAAGRLLCVKNIRRRLLLPVC